MAKSTKKQGLSLFGKKKTKPADPVVVENNTQVDNNEQETIAEQEVEPIQETIENDEVEIQTPEQLAINHQAKVHAAIRKAAQGSGTWHRR